MNLLLSVTTNLQIACNTNLIGTPGYDVGITASATVADDNV